ncbi:unnamed protein product [Caenorhabditis nigoni]
MRVFYPMIPIIASLTTIFSKVGSCQIRSCGGCSESFYLIHPNVSLLVPIFRDMVTKHYGKTEHFANEFAKEYILRCSPASMAAFSAVF